MWIPAFDLRSRVSTGGRALPHRGRCAGEPQPHDDPARHGRMMARNYTCTYLQGFMRIRKSRLRSFSIPYPARRFPAKFSRMSLEARRGCSLGDRKRPRLKPYVKCPPWLYLDLERRSPLIPRPRPIALFFRAGGSLVIANLANHSSP